MKRILAVLVLLALVGGAVYYLLRKPPEAAVVAPLPGLLTLIPSDAVAVAYVDLAAMRAAPFWQKTNALFPAQERDREFQRFSAETGFDYERDLDRAVIAWQPFGKNDTRALAFADGRFDRARLRAYTQRNGKIESLAGRQVFLFEQKDQPAIRATLLSETRLLLAQGEAQSEAQASAAFLSLLDATPSSPLPEQLRAQLAEVDGAPTFAVVHVAALPQTRSSRGNSPLNGLTDLRSSMDWLAIGARPEGERLKILLQAQSASTLQAIQLDILLDGFKMLAGGTLRNTKNDQDLSAQEKEALLALLDSSKTSRTGSRVQVRMEVTYELVKRLVQREQREKKGGSSVGR